MFVDCAIIGDSVAGIAAACRMVSHRRSVLFARDPSDGAWVGGFGYVAPTPLNTDEVSGEAFYERALQRLSTLGLGLVTVPILRMARMDREARDLILSHDDGEILASAAIFAPNGTPSRAPWDAELARFVGRGVSYDVASDGSFVAGRPAVVLGCGPWAVHQALVAARRATRVIVACEESHLALPPEMKRRLDAFPSLDVWPGWHFESITPDEFGNMSAVVLSDGTRQETIGGAMVFIAPDLNVRWDLWGGEAEARIMVEQQLLFPCGLAADISYWDHEMLFRDGTRVADECEKSLATRGRAGGS